MTLPAVSVVIPAYNEQASIGACLDSLAAQDYPGPVEIIVVDNASTDATADIARARGATVVRESTRGVCHARQRGTTVAAGEIVVSTDADTTFPTDWLSRVATVLTGDPALVATCGPCHFVEAPWWGVPYTRGLFGITALVFRLTRRVIYASATNIAFRRAAWDGYDTRLTQGGDELGLLRSLRRHGPLHFDPSRMTLTSSRRLHRGLLYNTFVTCLFFYFGAYVINRLAHRTVVGAAPAIRPGATSRVAVRARLAGFGVALAVAVAWWLTPVDVV